MSYRNPKVYAPDPTAFAKSFMGSFQSTMQGFEAEKEKKRQQQEKDDLIEAEYLRYTNIGDLEGVSESINSALQDSINNMVDSKTFVKMSAVERQKVLNDIGNIKAGSQSLVELLSIDPSEISNRSKRSNPELHAILSQMRLDPSKIKISGDLTNPDVKFNYTDENGNVNTTSLRDLRRYKNTYVSRIDDENNFNKGFDNFIEGTQKLIKEDAAKGKATKTSILDNFLIKGYDENNNRIYNEQALSNDDKAHIWYEMMEDKDKENLKTFDLYPKGQKPEDRKMQDQAIYDYYYNMANQKLIQPAVRDTTTTTNRKSGQQIKYDNFFDGLRGSVNILQKTDFKDYTEKEGAAVNFKKTFLDYIETIPGLQVDRRPFADGSVELKPTQFAKDFGKPITIRPEMTDEEIRRTIARALGVPEDIISQTNFSKDMELGKMVQAAREKMNLGGMNPLPNTPSLPIYNN